LSKVEHPAPRVSISYSWEDEAHMQWMGEFAARLRGDGVDVSLDQWLVGLGKPLPEFMEKLVRENERVLVICTPTYKEKSDGRIGGVGYEGDLMTGEMLTQSKREKFILILCAGNWIESIPSWLSGRSGVDLRGEEYSESEYGKLVDTLHRRMPQAPPLGPSLSVNTRGGSRRARDVSTPQPPETSDPIKIVGVIEEEVTLPRNDETRDSAVYAVPFQLSRHPSSRWARLFVENWNNPPSYTTMHRPGIAKVRDDKIILDGTTMYEVERYHAKTLKLALQKTNDEAEREEEKYLGSSRELKAARLREENERREGQRNSIALRKGGGLNVVLLTMKAGDRLEEHRPL
jgi:hypothetical protein